MDSQPQLPLSIRVSIVCKQDVAITTWLDLSSNKDAFAGYFFRTGFNETGNLRSYAEEDGDSKAIFITDNEFDDSNWHHAVFTRKGSSAAIYVDGGLLETKSGTTKSGDLGTNDFWFIGQNGLNADWFRGNLDDIRLYNRALSAAEVAQLHSLEKPPVITAQPQSQVVATGSNVTLSADANGTGLNYQWYRNGAAITGATGATYTITGAHNDEATLGGTAGYAKFLKGRLDDMRIYNRDLNATEIATLAGIDPNRGLLVHYPFDGNANDESGNNNNGSVTGATLIPDRHGNTNKAYSFDGTCLLYTSPSPRDRG